MATSNLSDRSMTIAQCIDACNKVITTPMVGADSAELAKNIASYLDQLKTIVSSPIYYFSQSYDWRERLKGEYLQLKDRLEKLRRTLVKIDAGTVDFKGNTTIPVLLTQEKHMEDYLHTLEVRMELERIEY